MITTGDHIIAGVSGGADSVCLLLVLLQLRQRLGHTVSVVHVEHGIRGGASLEDAAFVMHFCEERSIKCHICHCRVPEYARANGLGEEEAGRHLRYAAFAEEKEKYPHRNVRIATAHHLDDQAETMLFQLVRGSGISGLAGMAPVCEDRIRPLLCVSRSEIESWLEERKQEYCTDATNYEDMYTRNRIRHHILPVLYQINPAAAGHMYQAAEELRETDRYISGLAAKELEQCCICQPEGVKIVQDCFAGADQVLQKKMLHQLLGTLAGSSLNITRTHVRQLLELFQRQCGRQIHLPYGLVAERIYEGIEIYRKKVPDTPDKNLPDHEKGRFSFRLIEDFSNNLTQISKKKYTKCFDYDKIKFGFCIRNRLPGDYLAVSSSGSRQKLKKYFINEKIPAKEREQLLLLADGSHIMWVVGYRISSYYKVSAYTRRILEVTYYGGEEE